MPKIANYRGARDPRFVTIQRGGLLDETHHRLLAGARECEWQRRHLPEAIRELVLSDEELRNKKFWGVLG
jgi:hypothetical protein